MPYMVNASLFYGNIQYMMNLDRFNSLSEADQTALLEAGGGIGTLVAAALRGLD